MENVSKALLIAAGFLIAIILISGMLIGYNQISNYYQGKSDSLDEEQRTEFNKKFENYEDKEVRGNELLSIMNLIDDYNSRETLTGYKEMELEVNIDTSLFTQFHYTEGNYGYLLSGTSSKITENKIEDFSNMTNDCITALQAISNTSITETTLQQLSSNIANIVDEPSSIDEERNTLSRKKRADLIKNMLNIDIFNSTDYTIKSSESGTLQTIKVITLRYYEFTQFKRAYFKCDGLEYDSSTGRVKKITFTISTDSSGAVKFN